jgi:hypothetical protein
MAVRRWVGAFLFLALIAGRALGRETPCCEPAQDFPARIAPVGGWHPYGGGVLHWWPRHCFPCCGGPDDYCRKKLPPVCWPPYPPYYIYGPHQACPPRGGCGRSPGQPH